MTVHFKACEMSVTPCTRFAKVKIFVLKMPNKWAIKIHAIGIMIATSIALFLKIKGYSLFSHLIMSQDGKEQCWGALSVYRISFFLVVYHALLSLLFIKLNKFHPQDFRWKLHDSYWMVKSFIWILLLVSVFFIPEYFFSGSYWIVSFFFANIFIFIQMIFLVDSSCSLSEYCLIRYDESKNFIWAFILIFLTCFCFGLSLYACIYLYIHVPLNPIVIASVTLHILFTLILSFLSTHPRIQDANHRMGLLPSALLCLYNSILLYSAFIYTNDLLLEIIGFVLLIFSLGYMSIQIKGSPSLFHVYCILLSFYMGSLLTNVFYILF